MECDCCWSKKDVLDCKTAEDILRFEERYSGTPRYLCKTCIEKHKYVDVVNGKWYIKEGFGSK